MLIAVDVREACRPQPTGKGRWTAGVVRAFLRAGQPLALLTDAELPSDFQGRNTRVETFPVGLRWHWKAAAFLKRSGGGIDAYLSPTSYIVPAMIGRRVRCIPVVHDLIAFRPDPHDRRARAIERLTIDRAVLGAAGVCTISDATRRDLLSRYNELDPSTVSTVYAGPLDPSPSLSVPDGCTVLCIGTLCPRKNQLRLLRAFAALPGSVRGNARLVLAGGRGWHDEEIVSLARTTEGAEWIGYVSEDQYRALMGTCTVFALPSLYEGFGLQVLDALQRGIPTLTSSRGSLAEVAGNAALLVDPEDNGDIARGLERLLRDADLRARLSEVGPRQAAQFTWDRTAKEILTVIEMARKNSK